MATFSSKDIQLLFVGGAATATTGAIAAMNDGEIGIFTPAGARVTEATAATIDRFIIVKKTANGGVPLVSNTINKKDLISVKRIVYTPQVEQVHNIGYNGTSGSIEAINDNEYHIRLSMRAEYVDNHGGLYMKHGFYNSDITTTQYEVASNLLVNLQNEFSKEPEQKILFEMLSSDAGTATTGTVTAVKGSKTVVASVPGDFQAGGLLRLGTATTSAVYKVASISGSNVTLETKITGASGVYAIAAAESVTAANAALASYGLRLTGVASLHVTSKLHNDLMPVTFNVGLENFGITTNVATTNARPGSGTERQVKELEWFCQGNEGDFHRMGEPNIIAARTEATGNYDLINLQIKSLYTDSIVAGPINKTYSLAIPETAPNYAIAATANDITDVLEVLAFGSTTGALAVT